MERLYLILPAYNEAANLAAVVADWYPMAAQAGADSRLAAPQPALELAGASQPLMALLKTLPDTARRAAPPSPSGRENFFEFTNSS